MADVALKNIDPVEFEKQYWWLQELQRADGEIPSELEGLLNLMGAIKDSMPEGRDAENAFHAERIGKIMVERPADFAPYQVGFATFHTEPDNIFAGREGSAVRVLSVLDDWETAAVHKEDRLMCRVKFLDDGQVADVLACEIFPYEAERSGFSVGFNGLTVPLSDVELNKAYQEKLYQFICNELKEYVDEFEVSSGRLPEKYRDSIIRNATALYDSLISKGWGDTEEGRDEALELALSRTIKETCASMTFEELEQFECQQLSGDQVLFAELPLTDNIGVYEVSIDLGFIETYVWVVYDHARREGESNKDLLDWEVVKSCIERERPNSPWVKHGLDKLMMDEEVTQEMVGSIRDHYTDYTSERFAKDWSADITGILEIDNAIDNAASRLSFVAEKEKAVTANGIDGLASEVSKALIEKPDGLDIDRVELER